MKKILNFRPCLFCALPLCFGLSLWGSINFSDFSPALVLFFCITFFLMLVPINQKRLLSLLVILPVFTGLGVGLMELAFINYGKGAPSGEYVVTATVQQVSERQGYSIAVLKGLSFDGEAQAGKCRVMLPADTVVAGDLIVFQGPLEKKDPFEHSAYAKNDFASDIRYTGTSREVITTAKSSDLLLRLNGHLYEVLYEHMEPDEASLCYALLSGNLGAMEEGLHETVRKGGIAHIFAVSGMHIGVLFSAAMLILKKLGRYAWVPSLVLSFLYCGFCGMTISSLRSLVMCGVFGASRSMGRKSDDLESLSFAAIVLLLFAPAQWYSAGFQLTFAACLGLSLFAGSFSRLLQPLHLPKFLVETLASTLGAQIVTAPILMASFGYLSVMGTLLNLILVPLSSLFFFCSLIMSGLALMLPFAADFLLAFPEALFSLLILLLSFSEWTLVLSGFAIGAGAILWLFYCGYLSTRLQMRRLFRAVAAVLGCALFAVVLLFENIVFSGCRLIVYEEEESAALLIQTREENVLVIDGDVSLSECEEFLDRNFGGELSAVVGLSADALNTAAFLNATEIHLPYYAETGFHETQVLFGKRFSYGELSFYCSAESLVLVTEGVAVEIALDKEAGNADFFIGAGSGGLKFLLEDGIIKEL